MLGGAISHSGKISLVALVFLVLGLWMATASHPWLVLILAWIGGILSGMAVMLILFSGSGGGFSDMVTTETIEAVTGEDIIKEEGNNNEK